MGETTMIDAVIPLASFERDKDNIKLIIGNSNNKIRLIFVLDMPEKMRHEVSQSLQTLIESHDANAVVIGENFNNPGSARNFGLTKATAEYIVFWDSDDQPMQEVIVEELLECKRLGLESDVIVGNYSISNRSDNFFRLNTKANTIFDLAMDTGLWRMVFKRSLIKGIEFPNLKMAEDQIYFLKVLQRNPKFAFSPKEFYRYFRNHSNRLTFSKSAFSDLPKAVKETIEIYETIPKGKLAEAARILIVRQTFSCLRKGDVRSTSLVLFNLVFGLHPKHIIPIFISAVYWGYRKYQRS